ncbi:MAG: ABC transporter substrate-binding protein [Clostridia bacterium]|nr:ABC transporter substrate-binding protein [Clostridia bacterium]
MKLKRAFALTLAFILTALTFSGCNAKQAVINTISNLDPKSTSVQTQGTSRIDFTIPYLRSDPIDPYKATTDVNRDLCSLLFDPLYGLDENFKPQPLIAENCKLNGKSLTVNIKSGLKFSDGSTLGAEDVKYSFKLAKASKAYSITLNNISSVEGEGTSLMFKLKSPNPYEANNLIFPIIKKDSDKTEKSGDSSASPPIGSGRYSIMSSSSDKILSANKSRLGGFQPTYYNIGLKDVTEASSVPNLFSMGEIDFYTNRFTDGDYHSYSGTATDFEMTNFVYLGINSEKSVFKDSRVKRALALLLNRKDLATVSFSSFARETSSPFHPSFFATATATLPPIDYDFNAGVKLLEEAGFKSDKGSSSGRELKLRLVVNNDNSFKVSMARSIQQYFAKADIQVELIELPYSKYLYRVENENFDIYLGETALPCSFDLSAFFTEGAGLEYGINTESAAANAYRSFEKGEINMQSFLDAFADDLPFIPIAYRDGIVIRSSKIKTRIETSPTDCFYNIKDWNAD